LPPKRVQLGDLPARSRDAAATDGQGTDRRAGVRAAHARGSQTYGCDRVSRRIQGFVLSPPPCLFLCEKLNGHSEGVRLSAILSAPAPYSTPFAGAFCPEDDADESRGASENAARARRAAPLYNEMRCRGCNWRLKRAHGARHVHNRARMPFMAFMAVRGGNSTANPIRNLNMLVSGMHSFHCVGHFGSSSCKRVHDEQIVMCKSGGSIFAS
jgi:hypothetical protein